MDYFKSVCSCCGKTFNIADAEDEFFFQFHGDPEYCDEFPAEDYCADCAIAITLQNKI